MSYMLYLFIFTTFNIKHNPQKIIKYNVENNVLLSLWGYTIRTKKFLMVLEICQFGSGKVLEILKVFFTNPGLFRS